MNRDRTGHKPKESRYQQKRRERSEGVRDPFEFKDRPGPESEYPRISRPGKEMPRSIKGVENLVVSQGRVTRCEPGESYVFILTKNGGVIHIQKKLFEPPLSEPCLGMHVTCEAPTKPKPGQRRRSATRVLSAEA